MWNTKAIRFRFTKDSIAELSIKSRAVYSSLGRCISIDDSFHKNVHLRPFHFPRSLMEWRRLNPKKGFLTSLSQQDVECITLNDGGRRMFQEYTNSVFHYNKGINIQVNDKYKKMYVQAPLSSRKDVEDFIKSISTIKPSARKEIEFQMLPKKNQID